MVTGKGTEQFSVYLPKDRAAELKALAEHYRWNVSQTLTELMAFHSRVMEWSTEFQVVMTAENEDEVLRVDRDDFGSIVDVECADSEAALVELLKEFQKGLLGSFRKPVPEVKEKKG